MMQKFFIGSLALLALMASCSSTSDDLEGGAAQENKVPIAFSSYLGKTATSRAGATGVQTTTSLQTEGFGLFAYYSDNSNYDKTSSKPNFMYNTKVTGTASEGTTTWTYSPLRYWPNETGTDGTNGATSEKVDHLTFFAYAPYVEATATTGAVTDATVGITALTKNSDAGDPKVSYTVASDPSKSVDLLWGVSNTESWANVTGTPVTLTKGLPYLNLIKPNTAQKVDFNFKHALSRLGLNIQGAFDQVAAGGTLTDAKITVAKVEITGVAFADKGVLNLNNTTAGEPSWTADGTGTLSLTIEGENLNTTIKDAGATKAASQPEGVTATQKSLMKDNNTYFMFIPGTATTDKPLQVKITYYTTTDDPNLATGYTRVENVITKSISATGGLKFEAGKAYTLNLVLGMTSVKVTATVADWADGSTTQVDLPINVE